MYPNSKTILFSVNKKHILNANQSLHFHEKGKRVKILRNMAREYGEENPIHFERFSILVKIYPRSRRRIDPPNLYPTVKALIDGLTDANYWEDDDYKHLKHLTFMYGGLSSNKENFEVEMIIQEVDSSD